MDCTRSGSGDGVDTLPVQKIEEPECRAGRLLVADFPLLDRRDAGIDEIGEHCLADVQLPAEGLDVSRGELWWRLKTEKVEGSNFPSIDKTCFKQIVCRFACCGEHAEPRFLSCPEFGSFRH